VRVRSCVVVVVESNACVWWVSIDCYVREAVRAGEKGRVEGGAQWPISRARTDGLSNRPPCLDVGGPEKKPQRVVGGV
jgi:hypothetical protein